MSINYKQGKLLATEQKILIIASKWNSLVVDNLISGAINTLNQFGANNIELIRVPGAWELPITINRILKNDTEYDYVAIIALGAVVEGETLHFDLIANGCNNGLAKLSLDYDIPILNGVLACRTMEQAMDRAGGKMGNKGQEAATAALEMISLLAEI